MNQLCYRIIFNKARGMLMAVAETVRNCTGSSSGGAEGSLRPAPAMARLSWIGLAVLTLVGATMTLLPRAQAQIVADPNAPRNQQPVVVNTANGVPQVNIQTPSAAGVSRNTYSQFDVQRNGAVLNNSRSDVQTQLGGWIQRNPNLANGTARVILNEVNSSNPSYLRGFVEVAGDRAQVIIANPSGVTCDGCGFINSARTTLTTGEVIMNGGNLDGYAVRGGRVRIEGAGMSDAQSDYTEIIARATEVNAGIWAKELHVTVGANRVNADHTQVTPIAAQDAAPAFGVDVAQLGGMYANKIFLVGTESGVGMRNAGNIGAAIGEISLTADGRIENSGAMNAQDKIRIHSAGVAAGSTHGVINTGSITATTSEVTLSTDGRIDNGGSVTAQTSIGVTGQDVHNSGTLSAAGSAVDVVASGMIDNSGAILAQTDVRLTGADVKNAGSIAATNGDVTVAASGAVDNSGSMIAQSNINITTQLQNPNGNPALRNDGTLSAVNGSIAVNTGGDIDNAGTMVARNDVRLNLSGANGTPANVNNRGSMSAIQGQVKVDADGSIDNAGSMIGQAAVDIAARHVGAAAGKAGLRNGGTISVAGGAISLAITGAIDNSGKIIARDGVDMRVASGSGSNGIDGRYGLRNTGDIGASAGAVQLNIDGGVTNMGAVIGQNGVVIATRDVSGQQFAGGQFDIDNSGSIQVADGKAQLGADGRVTNSGTITATQAVDVDAANLARGAFAGSDVAVTNNGIITATAGASTLVANGGIRNSGTIAAQSDVNLTARNAAASLYNEGKIQSTGGTASLIADGQLSNTGTGTITAKTLSISAQDVVNDGSIGAQAAASLASRSGFRQSSAAAFAANGNMVLNLAGNYSNAGQLRAGTLSLSAAQISNLNTAAIQADTITINGSGTLTNAGEISSRNLLDITAPTVDNTGVILGGDLVVRAQTLNNTGNNALLGGGNSMSLWVTNLLSNRNNAVIYSAGSMAIGANDQRDANGLVNGTTQITNEDSIIEAGGNMELAAVSLRNTRSGVAVSTVQTLDESYAMRTPSWWHNGGNQMYYKPDSSNFNAYEILYVNPADVLETKNIITPDGYVIGRAVIRTHADDSVFYKGISSNWATFGQISRGGATDGTRVVYFTAQSNNISNPDKVAGGDDPRDGRSDINWEPMPGYSNQYGNCTTNCIRFVAEQDYTDPNTIFRRDTQRYLAQQHDALELIRNAHHTATEDRLASGAGAVAEIRAGGNARINIGQSLSNEFSNIVVNGSLWLGGTNANIANLGQTLYRRHSFDGTFTTTGGAVAGYSMPDISEVIGTTQGAIVGNGGVTIIANNFSNADLSAGSAANIRNDITPATGSGQSIGGMLGGVATRSGSNAPTGGALPSGSGLPTMSGFPAGALFPQNGNVPVPLRPGVLFQPSAGGSYLLETRSQFTDHRTWLSSDYLLTALNVDPSTVQKRLGDGYYEQRLVREQIAQLTGKVTGAASDDSQYQTLLSNGVSTAQAWGLRPGVELTPDQVSHLTSDMVWLVSQTVTLPDGSTQDVLVPRVYLAHLDDGALQSTGALVSGSNVTIQAANITNKGGMIDGRADGTGRTVLVASNDLANLGGGIRGDDIVITAGGNVRNETLTVQQTYANGQTSGSFTSLSNAADITAGKNLTINAGADINIVGGALTSGRSGDAGAGALTLNAGRDINLNTVKTGSTYDINFDGYVGHDKSINNVGATISAGGDLQIVAQRDVSMTAAQVAIGTNGSGSGAVLAGRSVTIGAALNESESVRTRSQSGSFAQFESQTIDVAASQIGAADGLSIKAGVLENADVKIAASNISAGKELSVAASGNINVVSEDAFRSYSEYATSSSKSFLSSRSSTGLGRQAYSDAVGSNLSGDSVVIQAGKDLNITGSNIVSNADTTLSAVNNVTISAAAERFEEVHQYSEKKSGFGASFGAGVASIGYSKTSANGESSSETVTQQGSTIVSLNGNTKIQAGQQLRVTASDIGAGNDLTLIGKSIDLTAAQNTSVEHSTQESSSSGFSVGITYNPLAAFKNAYQQSARGNPSTSFLGQATKRADATADGVSAATTAVVVQAGSRSANSNQDYATSSAKVSTLTAGNNLTLLATDGSITSQGTAMSAAGDALLIAKNNITLDVARSYETQGQTNIAKGWSLDNRGTLPVGMFNNNGKGDGTTTTVMGTSLSAGRTASLSTTQGDITLTAANLVANGDLSISAAKNLTIQSGQDILANANKSNNQAIGKVVVSDTERFSGYHTEKNQDDNSGVTQIASNVGSLQGNVNLRAGDSYTQTASNVLAANNIDINAKAITINTADNTGSNNQSSDSLKIGAFARISSPLIDLANNVENAKKSDGRLQAMQSLAAAANGYQVVSAMTGGSGDLIKGEVGVGFATADSEDHTRYTQAQGSTIQGGGNVTLTSTEGDIHATGASIAAGSTLTLDSAREILLDAARSTVVSNGDNHSAGAEIGVGFSVGAKTGVYAYISANIGNGRYDYNALTNSNTQLSGDTVTLKSQGDTTLKGATVHADTINALTGGKLTIESVQDQITQHSEQSSVGGRLQIAFGTAWEASGSLSQSTANGSSSFVNQQSGLFAGNGGYHVVADTIALKGGAIASSNAGNSDLSTKSISFEDITNKMEYSADTMSVSGSFGGSLNKADSTGGTSTKNGSEAGATPQDSKSAPSPNLTPGIMLQDSVSASSTTYGTLTDGKITIGGQATSSAAGLGAHTDLATANDAIAALPDLKNVMKEQQAMAAAANTVIAASVQFAGDQAAAANKQATQANANIKKSNEEIANALAVLNDSDSTAEQQDDARRAMDLAVQNRSASLQDLSDAQVAAAHWGTSGDYTRALKAVTGVLVGGVAGQSIGQLASNASAPYLAEAIGAYFTQPGNENKTAQVLSHAVLGGLLAAANGGSAAAGAGAGAAGELAAESITKALYPQAFDADGNFHPERLDAGQANTIIALSSAVGLMTANLIGGSTQNALIGANVTSNSVLNNWLGDHQKAAMNKELSAAKSIAEKWKIAGKYLLISGRQDLLTATGIGLGLAEAGWSDVQGLAQFLQEPAAGLAGIQSLISNREARDALGESVYNSLSSKIESMKAALVVGGDDVALQLGKDVGGLLWQVGSVLSGIGGISEATISLAKAGVKVSALTADAMRLAAKILKADAKGLGGVVDIMDIGMKFGAGIKAQGLPFEAYVQSKLPTGTLDLNSIKTNFKVFDHFTPEGMAVSTKTLDTSAVTYQNSSAITRTLNDYVDKIFEFAGDGKIGGPSLNPDQILSKQMQLAIPASTNAEQISAIAKSIQYAQSKNIQIIVTKVK